MPTTPQHAAGWRMEPPVSDPKETTQDRAATAAADPPLLPPGMVFRFHGLWVGPNALCSHDEPMANSSMFNLPSMTAPVSYEPGHDGGVIRSFKIFQKPGSASGLGVFHAKKIFYGYGDSEKRRILVSGADFRIGVPGGGDGLVPQNAQIGVHPLFGFADAL